MSAKFMTNLRCQMLWERRQRTPISFTYQIVVWYCDDANIMADKRDNCFWTYRVFHAFWGILIDISQLLVLENLFNFWKKIQKGLELQILHMKSHYSGTIPETTTWIWSLHVISEFLQYLPHNFPVTQNCVFKGRSKKTPLWQCDA